MGIRTTSSIRILRRKISTDVPAGALQNTVPKWIFKRGLSDHYTGKMTDILDITDVPAMATSYRDNPLTGVQIKRMAKTMKNLIRNWGQRQSFGYHLVTFDHPDNRYRISLVETIEKEKSRLELHYFHGSQGSWHARGTVEIIAGGRDPEFFPHFIKSELRWNNEELIGDYEKAAIRAFLLVLANG